MARDLTAGDRPPSSDAVGTNDDAAGIEDSSGVVSRCNSKSGRRDSNP